MNDRSPAEELRAAASLIRGHAQAAAAAGGPWQAWAVTPEGDTVLRPGPPCGGPAGRAMLKTWTAGRAAVEYAAAMHPGVALAVAGWLDAEADDAHAREYGPGNPHALAVARAYLGGGEGGPAGEC